MPAPTRHIAFASALAAAGLLAAPASQAATFCVVSSQDLTNTLAIAATNGANDEIRIQGGIYPAPVDASKDGFYFNLFQPQSVVISGGWEPVGLNPCGTQVPDASRTMLYGSFSSRVLTIAASALANGSILEISNLRMSGGNGSPVNTDGGAMAIQGPVGFGAALTIERTIIDGNQASSGSGGGLLIEMPGPAGFVRLRGNLIAGNVANFGGGFSINTPLPVFMTNNTIVGNSITSAGNSAALSCANGGSACDASFSNNIVYGNLNANGAKRSMFIGGYETASNIIEGSEGVPIPDPLYPDLLDTDPGFVGNDNFQLRDDSIARDAGAPNPAGGQSALDVQGVNRVYGPAVDIGAFEFERLFGDGFED